jgi:TatD DNase family protein
VRLVDSHAHLDQGEFDPDREDVIARAFAAGLEGILCPADLADDRSLELVLDLVRRHPEIVAAAGVHPHQARLFDPSHEARLRDLAARGLIAAVGEIGLDFHYDYSPAADQRRAFRAQLEVARDVGLPVIVHSRKAGPEICDSIREAGLGRGGVLHCFTETWEIAGRALDLGLYLSFSGILTFPKAADLRQVAGRAPADRLLVETDAPYLAPVPYRGRARRNEPAWVVETARVLAGLRGLPESELADLTTANFRSLFSFEK